MRVLFVGMRYDYGDPSRGDCYEYVNFFGSLSRMPSIAATHFPFDVLLRAEGKDAMNRRLLEAVAKEKPDLCFFTLFTDEIAPETLQQISTSGNTVTLNWFADDHWRFLSYSRHWAPFFHYVATTDSRAVAAYAGAGVQNVIKTQWGFNHFVLAEQNITCDHRVSFVGQVHSQRRKMVDRLRRAGVDVVCRGKGWEGGRLPLDEMHALFCRSGINLNFAESSVTLDWKPVAKVFLNRRADDTLHLRAPARMLEHIRTLAGTHRTQIKARSFEIPGVGGFLLTDAADNLDEYFVPGREIATFSGKRDLLEKVLYYLEHDEEREAIRAAGHARALKDHTYEQRFLDLFQKMGLHEKIR